MGKRYTVRLPTGSRAMHLNGSGPTVPPASNLQSLPLVGPCKFDDIISRSVKSLLLTRYLPALLDLAEVCTRKKLDSSSKSWILLGTLVAAMNTEFMVKLR